jgi:hypothetical protein
MNEENIAHTLQHCVATEEGNLAVCNNTVEVGGHYDF